MAEWKLVKAPPEKTYLQASAFVRAYNDEPTEAVKALVRAAMTIKDAMHQTCTPDPLGAVDAMEEKIDRLHALCPELFERGDGDA